MNLDTGVDSLPRLYVKHMASREVYIRVSDENLSKPRVQDINNIAKVQPNYGYQRIYTNNDEDLEREAAIFHQSIEKVYEVIPRGQLCDEVLQNTLIHNCTVKILKHIMTYIVMRIECICQRNVSGSN